MCCSGIVLSVYLKALGVESLIVDRHPQPGDNWRLRYDCMRFHVAKSYCETPYLCKVLPNINPFANVLTSPLSVPKGRPIDPHETVAG